MCALTRFILYSQYLHIPTCGHYRTVEGSGMGMICSGELSDLNVHTLAEESFIRDELSSGLSLVGYARYKDDGLMLMKGCRSRRQAVLRKLSRLMRPYVVKS